MTQMSAFGNRCPYCLREFAKVGGSGKSRTRDHVIPKSVIRQKKLSKPRNVQECIPVCSSCNHLRGNTSLVEFLTFLDGWRTLPHSEKEWDSDRFGHYLSGDSAQLAQEMFARRFGISIRGRSLTWFISQWKKKGNSKETPLRIGHGLASQ